MDNRDLINQTIERIGKIADANGIEFMTAPQQTLLYAWMAFGVVGNGGFPYFYEVSGQVQEVMAAYRTLGLDEWAEAFQASRSVFPGGKPEAMNSDERDEWIRKEDVEALLDPYERWMYSNGEALEEALVQYIEQHPGDFDL